MYKSLMFNQLPLPFQIMVETDMKNTKKHCVCIQGPSVILPDASYYKEEMAQQKEMLLGIWTNMAKMIMAKTNLSLEDQNKYIEDMMGYDEDLVAHLMITKLYGKVLVGKPIDSVFGWIDQKKYFESIVADVKEAKKEIVQQPMYVILNLCRVMAFKQENKILSKRAGGEWGLVHFPTNYHSLIQLALKEYRGETVLLEQYNDSELNDFADITLSLLFK